MIYLITYSADKRTILVENCIHYSAYNVAILTKNKQRTSKTGCDTYNYLYNTVT